MRISTVALAGALAGTLCLGGVSAEAQFQGRPAHMPDGAGKELVEAVCVSCHNTGRIAQSYGYSEAGWRELIATMVDISGSPDAAIMTGYLAEHFPAGRKRGSDRVGRTVEGSAEIKMREWVVPTLGQRARDPVEAPDGSIWWVGQWGNLIGRIDRRTGEMTEYPLPDNALPHTVSIDRDGNAWYTGNKNGTVGRFDPKTGTIIEYKMPDPAARDPHTAVFDRDGILWFTLQQSNMAGRLDPATGEVRLVTFPTAGSRPYGIKLDADGDPWISCNGSNCLVRMDRKTMALKEYKLPHEGTTVRRLDIAADGGIWYVNSSRGRLGRLDPATGTAREWPSPSGPKSHPYAIAVVDGIVWYNESGVRPDMLVRFDPATEKFQNWPIPSGGVYAGILRHMRPTRDGNLLIHQSGTNRIIEVLTKPGKEVE